MAAAPAELEVVVVVAVVVPRCCKNEVMVGCTGGVCTIAFGLGCVLGFLPALILHSKKRMVSFEALATRLERWVHLRSLSTQQERHILNCTHCYASSNST
jgi:hypothetical protein